MQAPMPGGTTSPTSVPAPGVAANAAPNINFGAISGGTTGSTGAPNAASNSNPLISQDQSSLSQYYMQQVGGYSITPGALPGTLSSTATIGQALQDLYQLSPSQLVQLQHMLLDAGFYENADGSVLSDAGAVGFGQADNQTWLALGRALVLASTSGQSVMNLLQQRIQSGVGVAQQNTLPQAVMGGGNTYEIDLTQPGAVNEVANSIFQAALGRNATPGEMQKILASVNAGELTQGRARIQAGETASQQKYQAQITQRNIAYQYAKNPKTALGPVPSGPFGDTSQWATALLSYMQLPVTPQNVAFILALSRQMGGSDLNPLAAQNPAAGSQPGQGGVTQFQNAAQGLQATAQELLNPKFSGIYYALLSGDPSTYRGVNNAVNVWSGGKFSSVNPTNAELQQGQGAVLVAQQQAQTGTPTQAAPPYMGGNAQSAGAEGGGPQAQTGGGGFGGTAQSTGAEGGGPGIGPNRTPASTVNQGQQPPNPGDQYLNPVTAYIGTPLSPEQAAYDQATTGTNRFSFAENNYLKAFLAVASMIKAGGPTGQ